MASNAPIIGPISSREPTTDRQNLTNSDRQCTEDAEFVDQVMRKDINCVTETIEGTEKSDAAKTVKDGDPPNVVNLSGTDEKISQIEKRKRESDSENSDNEINVRKKSKGAKLKSQGRRNALKVISDKVKGTASGQTESDISDIETETDSDIVIMLKALTILEKKIDRRFDEIKENNSDSIRQIKVEIDAVKSDFNNRMEGLTKKVESKVTDSVQKIITEKLKTAQSDLKKNVSRTVSQELKKDIDNAQYRMNRLDDSIKNLQDLVNDVMSNNDPTSKVREEERAHNIVIRNLPETENENTLNKVNALIKDGLNLRAANCTRAVRKQSRRESQSGVVIATCCDRDAKADIMKAKSNLKRHRVYEHVFIEHDRPRSERNQISSLRTLVQAVGRDKVRMRGSRVIYYNAELTEGNDVAMDTNQRENRSHRVHRNADTEGGRRDINRDDRAPFRPRRPPPNRRDDRDRGQEREQEYRNNRYEHRDRDRNDTRNYRREADHDRYAERRRDTGRYRREHEERRR